MRLITINETVPLSNIIESMRAEMLAFQQIINHDRNVEFQRKNKEYARFLREQEWKAAESELEGQRVASFNIRGNTTWDEVQDNLDDNRSDEEIEIAKKRSNAAKRGAKNRKKKETDMIERYIKNNEIYHEKCKEFRDRGFSNYYKAAIEFADNEFPVSDIPPKIREKARKIIDDQ